MVTEYVQFFVLQCTFACFTHKGRHEVTELRSGQGTFFFQLTVILTWHVERLL